MISVYDCPVFDDMDDFAVTVASASITAADIILQHKGNLALVLRSGDRLTLGRTIFGFPTSKDLFIRI